MAKKTPNLNKRNVQPIVNGQGNGHEQKTKLSQYVGFFTVGFILASAIAILIQSQFALNPYLVVVLSVLVGAYIAVHKFIKHQQRPLQISEINRLTFASIAVIWLLTAGYFLAIWLWLFDAIDREVLMEMSAEQPLPLLSSLIMVIIVTIVSARIGILACNRLLAPK